MTSVCEANSSSRAGSSDAIARMGVIDCKITQHDGKERIVSAYWRGRDVSSEGSEKDSKKPATQSVVVEVFIKNDGLFDNDIFFLISGDKELIEKFERVDESIKCELCIRIFANSLDNPYKIAQVDLDGVGGNFVTILPLV